MRRDLRVASWLSVCVVAAFSWSASAVASGALLQGLAQSTGIPTQIQDENVTAAQLQPPSLPRMSLESPFTPARVLTSAQLSADVSSRTAYEKLSGGAAVSLAMRDFHIQHPTWTAPAEEGMRVEKYLGESVALAKLPSGKRVVVSSTMPLRTESVSGRPVPVSLKLLRDGEGFVPQNPLVPVVISKRAAGGIALPRGLSVAPTSANGPVTPTVVGHSAVFANAGLDTDLTEEALPNGADVAWQLRSQRSSPNQSLRFTLPPGASLRASAELPGAAEVLEEGKRVLLVPPASAQAADGRALATSYSINGDKLVTHVDLSGDVDFPVFVDPALYLTYYGESSGAGSWAGWQHYLSAGYLYSETASELEVGASELEPFESYGEVYIGSPGPQGLAGSAGITRVNVYSLGHGYAEQSAVQGEIVEANGSNPIYTIEPSNKEYDRPAPMNTLASYVNQTVSFCAQAGPGSNSEEAAGKPLCAEAVEVEPGKYDSYYGKEFFLDNVIAASPHSTATSFTYIKEAEVIYLDPSPPNKVSLNHSGYEGEWLKAAPTNFTIEAEDEGLGIDNFELQIPAGNKPYFTQHINCTIVAAQTTCPRGATSESINLSEMKGTGEFTLAPVATDLAGNWKRPEGSYVKLYLDQTEPVIGELTGALAKAANGQVGEGKYALNFTAEDGSTAAPQSGVKTLQVEVDGEVVDTVSTKCGKPIGVPAAGCFALSGSWTFNAPQYGVGTHTVSVVATDWAGNESKKSLNVTVNPATYEPLGPGAVNLTTGNYRLTPTDVSISGGAASLSVSRTYDSENLTQGLGGPLGHEWVLSLPDSPGTNEWQSVEPLPDGSIAVYGADRNEIVFAPKSGGGYNSPPGYQTDTLTEPSTSPAEYEITDAKGDYTRFAKPATGALFMPSKAGQATAAGGLNKVTYFFVENKGIIEPTEILAPEPSEGACTAKLVQGCRALTFSYASSTTATGEAESEWGEYKSRLAKIAFTAWEPTKAEMTTTVVAEYRWDADGRLRAEWDPRISPALKTTYAYDGKGKTTEGHVIAVTPPGQEPWLLNYESTNPFVRLQSVDRLNAETPLWKGEALTNTTAPTLSTTSPEAGTRLTVSTGKWSANAAYTYRWELCGSFGTCSPVVGPGSETSSFTPLAGWVGDKLVAVVTATNASGSVSTATAKSAAITNPNNSTLSEEPLQPASNPGTTAVSTVEYEVPLSGSGVPQMSETEVSKWGQKDDPVEAAAIFPPDEPQGWPASDYKRATVYYTDYAGRTVNVANPSGGIATSEYTTGTDNLERYLSPDNREAALKYGGKSAEKAALFSTENTYNPEGTELTSTLGPQHTVKLANGEEVLARKHTQYLYEEGAPAGGPYYLVTKTTEGAEIAGREEAEKRTVTTSYSGQEDLGWKLHAPTATSTSTGTQTLESTTAYSPNTGAVTEQTAPGFNKPPSIPAYETDFGSAGSEAGELKGATAVASDETTSEDVWVADTANNRIDEFSPSGQFIETFGWGVTNGKEKLQTCTSKCKAGLAGAGKGQLSEPQGIAWSKANGDIYVSDTGNNRIVVYTTAGAFVRAFGEHGGGSGQLSAPRGVAVESGGDVLVADHGNSRVDVFTAEGTLVTSFGKEGKGGGEFTGVGDVAICDSDFYVTDSGGERVEQWQKGEFGKYQYVRAFGEAGKEGDQFAQVDDIACDPANEDLYVTDSTSDHVDVFSNTGGYLGTFGSSGNEAGQFNTPAGVALNSAGQADVVDSTNNRIQHWALPAAPATRTDTIYYTTAPNSSNPSCGNHAEWAGLPCEAIPQGGAKNEVPTTIYSSYNIWDEPLTTKDVGTKERTANLTYDPAGRLLTSALTSNSTADLALPPVSDEYSATTGALVKQSTTSEGSTKTITSTYNNLLQPTSYTDASGNVTKYEYEPEKDYRLTRETDGEGTPAASSDTYTYNTTSGEIAIIKDSAAGPFSAYYDVEGNITMAGYPNDVFAYYTRNTVGEPIELEYAKAKCGFGKSCTWYTDSVAPSIHGQWLSQTSTFSKDSYKYNEVSWLTEAQETPVGKTCTARLYGYNEDGDRTSLTTRESPNETCASTGGTTQNFDYAGNDRLDDPGTTYDPFGNTTSLPGADAGGSTLTTSYYVDGAVAALDQNGQDITYNLDPDGRPLETSAIGVTNTFHYAGPERAPAWTSSSTGGWTRNITGMNGQLAAIQTNDEAPILQLTDLHGDIVGTAADSETETKLVPAGETTEYGVPRTSNGAKYSWLGGDLTPTELPTGLINMGARAYVPELGRFEQTDPQPGGSVNAYAYTDDDPINEADPTGEYTSTTTYNYEAAGNGAAPPGTAEEGEAPGAILPATVSQQVEEEFLAHPPWDAASQVGVERVIWEREGGECSGTNACAAGFLGFKVNIGEITEWWRQAKKGWELIKRVVYEPLVQSLEEQKSVCKAVGYATSVGSYFIPEGKFAKALGVVLGVGTTFAC
jgi:RHS repeat-associated protein